jgi:hypothetical protein
MGNTGRRTPMRGKPESLTANATEEHDKMQDMPGMKQWGAMRVNLSAFSADGFQKPRW